MKLLNSKRLCMLLSLILILLPASLLAQSDNCCPDNHQNCHLMNMAMPCSQCAPAAMSLAVTPFIADQMAVMPQSFEEQYTYPPIYAIWRPPQLVRI